MKIIKVSVEDADYGKLVIRRKREGLPSVASLLLKNSGLLTDTAEANEIARRAMRLAQAKSSGSRFRLRDLFPQNRWEQFSKGARLRAGRMFFAQVASATHGIRAIDKSSSNHQYYQVA